MAATRRARETSRTRLVTLSTDLGWAYAAQIKGVLCSSLPPGSVVDLAHDLPAGNILSSAFLLHSMARRFPAGSVHLAVVDPGVGGERAPVAVRCRDGTQLVGPDNGLLSLLAEELGVEKAVRLRPITPDRVGATFDGRDLFAPVAARLASGEPLERFGTPHTLQRLALPRALRRGGVASGAILWVDPFGNLITNLPSNWVPPEARTVLISVGRSPPRAVRVAPVYENLAAGELGLLPSSFGSLELAVRDDSASNRLGATGGEPVSLARATTNARARRSGRRAPPP
ncbi:MAG: SAM-dependent chlorinase/fluorinase [Thermoplasmata archaeon]|nr:SAM-dependent chlorinase/fluorinase [Thermoplasmata archaeon]